jgi:hypothetical protein
MIEKLRQKEAPDIPVQIGNFSDFTTDHEFDLIFVVFNTFFGLLTQEEQVSCFKCVAKSLAPGGRFLMEAFAPDLSRFDRGQTLRTTNVSLEEVRIECAQHDGSTQRVVAQLVMIRADGIKLFPVNLRYAWPSELDLMAQLAGLRLKSRWGGWNKEPFTGTSQMHVSVYEK